MNLVVEFAAKAKLNSPLNDLIHEIILIFLISECTFMSDKRKSDVNLLSSRRGIVDCLEENSRERERKREKREERQWC